MGLDACGMGCWNVSQWESASINCPAESRQQAPSRLTAKAAGRTSAALKSVLISPSYRQRCFLPLTPQELFSEIIPPNSDVFSTTKLVPWYSLTYRAFWFIQKEVLVLLKLQPRDRKLRENWPSIPVNTWSATIGWYQSFFCLTNHDFYVMST